MAIFVSSAKVKEWLKTDYTKGKRLLRPSKEFSEMTGFPVKILEDCEVTNEGEIHEHEGDLWQCLEGEAIFFCGGELENPEKHPTKAGEWKGSRVKDGSQIILRTGDWLWIPAGEPHQHNCPNGVARMVIIKVPVKK